MDLDIMDNVMELCGMGFWEGQVEDLAQEDGAVSPIYPVRLVRHPTKSPFRPGHTTLPRLLCFASPRQLRDELY
jgi:hypothetical protein